MNCAAPYCSCVLTGGRCASVVAVRVVVLAMGAAAFAQARAIVGRA